MQDKIRCLNCNTNLYRNELVIRNDFNGELELCPNCGAIQFIEGWSYCRNPQSPHSLQTYYELEDNECNQ